MEQGQQRATEMEHVSHAQRLREWGSVSLENQPGRFRGLRAASQYL